MDNFFSSLDVFDDWHIEVSTVVELSERITKECPGY